jgi:hypothetical protein
MFAVIVVMAGGVSALSAEKEKLSVQSLPPVVVKTIPESGDTKVDPTITEIKVTFSKKMADGGWSPVGETSWMGRDIRYLPDGKTWVAPVTLEPGKTYAVWLNTEKFHNFTDTKGRPAMSYLLVFETAKK